MATPRKALGRGLGALIPDRTEVTQLGEDRSVSRDSAILELPLDQIVANPRQPRRSFDGEDLRSLADSLRLHGVLQPLVVRRAGDRYELIVGERRWRAARLAGLSHVPAAVKDVASRQLLELALVENVQRRDLNAIELALAFRTLVDGGATQEEVGRRVGYERSTVANHLRLLELPREVQEDVEAGRIGVGHAKALLQVPNPERRHHLRNRVVAEDLSVRATEELARGLSSASGRTGPRRRSAATAQDPNLQQLLDALRDHLKTRVRVTGSASRGKLEIEFYGPEELNRVARQILEGGSRL